MDCPYCGEEVPQADLDYDGSCPHCHADLVNPPQDDEPDDWMELGDAAEFTQISRDTLMGYIENGDLEYEKEKVLRNWETHDRYWISLNSLYELLGKRGEVLAVKLKGKSRKGGRIRKRVGPLSESEYPEHLEE